MHPCLECLLIFTMYISLTAYRLPGSKFWPFFHVSDGDASRQGFYDNRMNEALWRHALLASDPTDSGGDQKESPAVPERANDPKQCSQCKSKRLHQLLRVKHQRSSCPFKDNTPREAKNLARRALNILDEEGDREGGIQEAIKRALAG